MRVSTLIDGTSWNGIAPAKYAAGFELKMA
jgi:hypothetical protein